jgi:hypothetical protein
LTFGAILIALDLARTSGAILIALGDIWRDLDRARHLARS